MWFRVELRKDGAVASCKEVEGLIPEKGGRVYYIEAENKEGALVNAARRYAEYLAQQRAQMAERRAKRLASGHCRECGSAIEFDPSGRRKLLCIACAKRKNDIKYGRREPGRQGIPSDRAKVARMPDAYAAALRIVLVEFDRMTPRSFRVWLVNEIERREPARVAAAE